MRRTAWKALVIYKNSFEYQKRLVALIAQKATLYSRWSAL
jgi:hypothetical protein